MSTNRFLNLAFAAAIIVGWMALAAHHDQQRAEGDARHMLNEAQRFEAAAHAICGINSSFNDLGDGRIQCRTHRGMKTHIAKVSQ